MSSATFATAEVFSLEHVDAHNERRSARKSGFRRPILTVYGEMPWWHGDENGPLGVSLTECDRSKGVWACPISRLEGSVGFAVHFSMLIDGASRIFFNLTSVVGGLRQASCK